MKSCAWTVTFDRRRLLRRRVERERAVVRARPAHIRRGDAEVGRRIGMEVSLTRATLPLSDGSKVVADAPCKLTVVATRALSPRRHSPSQLIRCRTLSAALARRTSAIVDFSCSNLREEVGLGVGLGDTVTGTTSGPTELAPSRRTARSPLSASFAPSSGGTPRRWKSHHDLLIVRVFVVRVIATGACSVGVRRSMAMTDVVPPDSHVTPSVPPLADGFFTTRFVVARRTPRR